VEAASKGAELVLFPEGFIGGYPRGFRFGLAVGVHNEEGRDEFRKYHASAIHVPGITIYFHYLYSFYYHLILYFIHKMIFDTFLTNQ